MARPREFDEDIALDAAVKVFAAQGFERSSTQSLIEATGIGRQSLYNIFGSKWGLYLAALRRYGAQSTKAHLEVLQRAPSAIAGIEAMIDHIAQDATFSCLGTSAVAEFGLSRPEVTEINARAGTAISKALRERIELAQRDREIAANIDIDEALGFVMMSLGGLRLAARGGADIAQLRAMGQMAMRALR